MLEPDRKEKTNLDTVPQVPEPDPARAFLPALPRSRPRQQSCCRNPSPLRAPYSPRLPSILPPSAPLLTEPRTSRPPLSILHTASVASNRSLSPPLPAASTAGIHPSRIAPRPLRSHQLYTRSHFPLRQPHESSPAESHIALPSSASTPASRNLLSARLATCATTRRIPQGPARS